MGAVVLIGAEAAYIEVRSFVPAQLVHFVVPVIIGVALLVRRGADAPHPGAPAS